MQDYKKKILENTDIQTNKIVGVLKVSNKIIYGLNSKKNPYYLFEPINKDYPKFLVSINDKKIINSNKYHYITIKFKEWSKKLPTGLITEVIGEIGVEKNEYKKILNHYNIFQKKLNLDKKYKVKGNTKLFDIISKEDVKDYVDIRDKVIISIDPKGSRDIDDALSYENKDNKHIIGVHIADVSFWIERLNLYKYINKKYFTIYCPDKKFNIFPNVLADHLFSLKQKQDRLSLSVFIHLDNDFNLIKYEVKKCIINVNKNMTYEQANKKINSGKGNIFDMFKISKHLIKLINKENIIEEDYDSHNMIEKYMLITNKLISEYLINNNKKFPLRVHKTPTFRYDVKECNIDNKNVINFLKYYQMESAIYKEYDLNIKNSYYHYGLDLEYYTHFTSPIRRYVDIIIHLKVKEIIDNKNNMILNKLEVNYEKINNQEKKNKKMYRELESINIINNKLEDKKYEGYIIDFEENILQIYIPELKYLYKKQIFNVKLVNILEFTIKNDIQTVKNITNNEIKIYKKFQKILLKLKKDNDKLNLDII